MPIDSRVVERLRRLGLPPEEVRESFARSGGKGGQNVNKVETGVILSHPKSGIVVRVSDTRSQARNREIAWNRYFGLAAARPFSIAFLPQSISLQTARAANAFETWNSPGAQSERSYEELPNSALKE